MSCSTDGLTIREMGELYQKVKRKIQRMEDELEMLRDRIVPATSNLTGMPGGHGCHGDPTGDIIVRIEILKEEIEEEQRNLDALHLSLAYGIAYAVDNEDDRSIVYRRFAKNEPYKLIAADVCCSVAHARNAVSKWGKETPGT